MKDLYRIFVEGDADKRFIAQLLESIFNENIPSGNIIPTHGYTNLIAVDKERTFINEMQRTTADGGINLVVFDADSNCETRRRELSDWERRSKVNFELFLEAVLNTGAKRTKKSPKAHTETDTSSQEKLFGEIQNSFLFPNNSNSGELEDLLRQIINPVNQPVMECWDKYEDSLKAINLPWKNGIPLTIPAKKTRIYAYLEALLGSSRSEKEKIKEAKRDYLNKNHWDLNAQALHNLIDFLESNLS